MISMPMLTGHQIVPSAAPTDALLDNAAAEIVS